MTDSLTNHDYLWELMMMVKDLKYVLFDSWYASLEDFKQVHDPGWRWLTRLMGNRLVTPADRRLSLDARMRKNYPEVSFAIENYHRGL